jgi:DNA end-binding protein Ku
VPKSSIDDRYRDTPYYLAPEDQVGQEAFAVIRDAMKKKKMVGIARVVMARRERVMMLEAFGKGIMCTTLHYPYEIRGGESVFEDIPELKLPDQMVGLAEDLIDKMSGEFEPDKFEDRYENAMIDLIRSKQEGLPAPKEKAASRPANVVNLMYALRRSVEGETGKGKPAAKAPAKSQPRPLPVPSARPRDDDALAVRDRAAHASFAGYAGVGRRRRHRRPGLRGLGCFPRRPGSVVSRASVDGQSCLARNLATQAV